MNMVTIISIMMCAAAVFAPISDVGACVRQFDKVVAVEIVQYQSTCVIALSTEPIYLKSEKTKLKEDIATTIGQKYGYLEVLVSYDTDIFYQLKCINAKTKPQEKILAIVETIRKRQ